MNNDFNKVMIGLILFIFFIGILIIPIFYLLTLQNTIKLTNPNKRSISPWRVWLYLIPIFGVFAHYNHILKINETLKEEFNDRRINFRNTQLGLGVGKAFSVIGIILMFVNIFLSIFQWLISSDFHYKMSSKEMEILYSTIIVSSIISIITSIIALICWIIYWAKISKCKRILLDSNNYSGMSYPNSENGIERLKQNASNLLETVGVKVLNKSNSNFQINPHTGQVKKCPKCNSESSSSNNFCTKCGFDFSKLPTATVVKLNENEKQCTECELVLNKDASQCSGCGYPFPPHKILNNQTAISKVELKKVVNIETPSITGIETHVVKTKPETRVSEEVIQKDNNTKRILYIVLAIVLLLVVGSILWYQLGSSRPSAEEKALAEKALSDSIAKADLIANINILERKRQDSLNNAANQTEFQPNGSDINNHSINEDDINTIHVNITSPKAYFYESPDNNSRTNKFVVRGDVLNFIEDGEDFVKAIYSSSNGNTTEGWILKSNTAEGANSSVKEFDNNPVSNEIFTMVEEMPEFFGGAMEMMKYIQMNIQYPQMAKEAGISGKCYLKFVVNSNGQIADVTVVKGVPNCLECDKEAIRVVKSMPNWKAGKQSGKAVNVYFNLPINFQLR